MDTIASILRKKYALIFVHGHYMILEARKTVRILEQVMSADKYLSYFSRQIESKVYLIHVGE